MQDKEGLMTLFLSDQVASVFKRDDDARLIVNESDGSVMLETTVADAERAGLHNPTSQAVTDALHALGDPGMLERAAMAPQRDVRLQVLCRLFIFDACVMTMISLSSAPLYFVNVASRVLLWTLAFSTFTGCASYLVALVLRQRYVRVAMTGLVCWLASMFLVCGSISGLLNDIAPQLVLAMWMFQSLTLVLYSRYVNTTEEMQTGTAMWLMCGVSLAAAAMFWWICFLDRAWIPLIVTLVVGGAFGIAYRGWELHLTDVTRYTVSTEDGWLSFIQFYTEPVLVVCHASSL